MVRKLTPEQLRRAWQLGATHYSVIGRCVDLLRKDAEGQWQARMVNRDGTSNGGDRWEHIPDHQVKDPQTVPSVESHHNEILTSIKSLLKEQYAMADEPVNRLIELARSYLFLLRKDMS